MNDIGGKGLETRVCMNKPLDFEVPPVVTKWGSLIGQRPQIHAVAYATCQAVDSGAPAHTRIGKKRKPMN